ncbi:uncharacterized protein LOC128882231 [Hylaeus volcanicus]|uniref:uncharacterized protein LOC128882231 n=1 Tax=Hylaeus volcanicus TaxID=313075 RepID=UPI0023B8130E|nr:uncharacterized protein LOC128882231 [Hylaeus volcanicus]
MENSTQPGLSQVKASMIEWRRLRTGFGEAERSGNVSQWIYWALDLRDGCHEALFTEPRKVGPFFSRFRARWECKIKTKTTEHPPRTTSSFYSFKRRTMETL